ERSAELVPFVLAHVRRDERGEPQRELWTVGGRPMSAGVSRPGFENQPGRLKRREEGPQCLGGGKVNVVGSLCHYLHPAADVGCAGKPCAFRHAQPQVQRGEVVEANVKNVEPEPCLLLRQPRGYKLGESALVEAPV